MGLRLKLALSVVGFVVAVLALASYQRISAEERILLMEMENRGRTLLEAFAIPCSIAIANNDITTLDNHVRRFAETADRMDLFYIAALDHEGRVLAHTSSGEFGKVYDDAFSKAAIESEQPITQLALNGYPKLLEVAVPMFSGLRWGTLRAGFTLGAVETSIQNSRNQAIITGLGLSFGAMLIAFFALSFMVIQPVVRMQTMARVFGAGNMQTRVSLHQKDEIGLLAAQLNLMADRIQSYTGTLENLVGERTAELNDTNAKLVDANRRLEHLAKTDELTGLNNRRQFMRQLEFEVRRGQRSERAFTLLMLDLDNFKHYNDTHGHPAGDDLLQRLSVVLQMNLRSVDVVARYGGEEFIIMLLDTGPEEGFATAVKLQQVVSDQPFPYEASQPMGRISLSAGVAFYPRDTRDGSTLIELADQALYRSKEDGRNRVTRFDQLEV
ncbi:diguanylate cyclase [Myxococcota bacterium]|nr:diguanylate cyclase [Myxococcota bacterium]